MRRPARIVYLVESPYNRRDHERFGIHILERRGVPVEIWDLTPALQPRLAAEHRPPDPIDWPGLKTFSSRSTARAALSALSANDFVVCILGYEPNSWSAYRALSRSGAHYAVLSAAAIPSASAKPPPPSPARLVTALFMRTPLSWLGVRAADFAIYGGERSRRGRPPVGASTEEIWAHGMDYDLYLAGREGPRREGTAVFLDEWVPYHPDYVRLSVAPYSSAERYYPALRAFFDRFERETGLRVVVAAHPRSRYEDHPDLLGGRRVERGRTLELLRAANAAIAHASTAVGQAVLFGLPIVITTTDDLRASLEGPIIEATAAALGKKSLDLDHLGAVDWKSELALDEDARRDFRRLYIKKEGTPELPLWEIVSERLGL